MVRFIENIGEKGLEFFKFAILILSFIFKGVFKLFVPRTYIALDKNLFFEQFYFKVFKSLPFFIFTAVLLGFVLISATVGFAVNYNLQEQVGKLLVFFLINEFAPLFTLVFVLFKYELISYENFSNTQTDKVYTVKLLISAVSIPSMALLFSTICLASGYIISSLYLNLDLDTYKKLIVNAVTIADILTLLFKSLIFAFLSVGVPMFYFSAFCDKSKIISCFVKILKVLLLGVLSVEIIFFLIF